MKPQTFELFYPMNPHHVNQGWGVNGAYYRANGINILGHNGLDLQAYTGQPIYAAHDGVAYFEVDANQGEGVVLITKDQYDYKGKQAYFKTIYWHMVDYSKHPQYKSPVLDYQQKNGGKGMPTKQGDIIGFANTTGLATGPHLHFGLKPMVYGTSATSQDATDDLRLGLFQNIESANGYGGAIDPTPYLNGKYADVTETPTSGLSQADQVAVIAATEQAKGNSKIADYLWSIVAFLKAFLPK